MLVDLHMHTTFSDGIYTPEQLVDMAVAAGLKTIAITDHDNTASYPVAAAHIKEKGYAIQLLRGVEIDTIHEGYTVHILGFSMDSDNTELQAKLTWTRQGRGRRIRAIVQKLCEHGFDLSFEEVEAVAAKSNSIGRPHVARTLVNKGYFPDIKPIFEKYIAKGKCCYVEQEKLTPAEAVALLHGAGGLACLAHPSEVGNTEIVEHLLETIPFDAVEVWHPSAREHEEWKQWLKLAQKHKLLTSGGSDFHGDPKRYPPALGQFKVNYEDVEPLIKLATK